MSRGAKPTKSPKEGRPGWAIRIADARKRRGLSQEALRKLVGAAQSTIGDYETGSSEPSLLVFERLAAALAVSQSWLILGDGFAEAAASFNFLGDDTESVESIGAFADLFVAAQRVLRENVGAGSDREAMRLALHIWQRAQNSDAQGTQLSRAMAMLESHRSAIETLRASPINPFKRSTGKSG